MDKAAAAAAASVTNASGDGEGKEGEGDALEKRSFDPEQRLLSPYPERRHMVLQELLPTALPRSAYLEKLDKQMKSYTPQRCGVSLLDRLDAVQKLPLTLTETQLEAKILEDMCGYQGPELRHKIAVKFGTFIRKKRMADEAAGRKALVPAANYWQRMVARTDELYVLAAEMLPVFEFSLKFFVKEIARDSDDMFALTRDLIIGEVKDPVRCHEKANDEFASRFKDLEVAEACLTDVLRARVPCKTGTQVVQAVALLQNGLTIPVDKHDSSIGFPELLPEGILDGGPAEKDADGNVVAKPPKKKKIDPATGLEEVEVITLKLFKLRNKFDDLDPTHFRLAVCVLKMEFRGMFIFIELEVHYEDIMKIALNEKNQAYSHYNFFRERLKGTVPEAELDLLLEEKLVFLVDATGIPVLLSLLVLIFTSGGEDLTKLPSNRIELYELGIESAISKRLLRSQVQGDLSSTDFLVHEWMRLFNLDRGAAMVQKDEQKGGAKEQNKEQKEATQKKEREHKPTRKAQMKFEDLRSNDLMDNMDKKANSTSQANTEAKDKQVFKLTPKEVYEVFQHGAQYLRKPVKAESSEQPRSRMMVAEPRREDAPTISHLNHSKAALSNASATLWDMSAAPGLYAVAPGPAAESWPGAGVFHGERGILCRPRGVQVNTTTLPMVCATSSGNPEMKAGLEAINGPNYAHWLFALVYPLLASVDDTLNRTGAQHVNLLLTWGRNARYNYFSPTLGSLLDADCQFNTYSPLAVSDARHCTTLARLHVSRMSWYARPFWSRAWVFADSISARLGHVRSSLVCQGTSLNAVGRVIVMLRNDHVAKNRESWNRHVWGLEKACTPAFQEWAIGRLGVQLECIRLNHSMPMQQVAKLVGGGDADPTIGMLAGHGAGLANIVFLRPGAVMLEIDAAVNARNDRNMFQQLAWHIGVRSYKIWLNREGKRHFPAVTPAHYRPSIRNASKLTVQQGCYCASVTVPPSLLEEMMRNASSLARGCADNHTEHHAVKAWAEQTFRSTYPVAPE